MFTTTKNWLKISAFAALLGFAPELFAQAVIFPQETQPGVAAVNQQGEVYTIKNDLLTATFEKTADGQLVFKGCPELDLLPSKDVFYVELGADGAGGADGHKTATIPSSRMTLKELAVENLTGDKEAAKGAFRFDGKAIKAVFTYKDNKADLTVVWRAILRDGSHYLRSKMEITANKNTRMYSMIPLKYEVDNSRGGMVPKVVGNTRGAVLVSDKLFAGLESPMGLNTAVAKGASLDMEGFTAKKWNSNSFQWKPGAETPAAILKNGTVNAPGVALSSDQVVASRGYVKFYHAGKQTITFNYASGGHRLNLVGVDVLNMKGEVVSHDYHPGFTGTAKKNNVYTVDIPAADSYQVRYFVEVKTESVASDGNVVYSEKIAPVQVIYDGKQEANTPATKKSSRALSKNELGENDEIKDTWKKEEWKNFVGEKLPQPIYDKGWAKDNIVTIDREIKVNEKGELNVDFQYKTGNNGLTIAGVFLLSEDGSKEISGDSHIGFSGNEKRDNVYKVSVPYAGTFKLRYYAEKRNNDSNGEITIGLPKVYEVHLDAPSTSTLECKWRRNIWLKKDTTWNVSAVVGLVAKDQARRSVAAYVERERAVPWRAYPIYNSWYELNINRNNDRNYTGNMHDYQCVEIVKEWQKNLYEPYGTGIEAFVWDDGWDIYGTWQFNKNFPNGFAEQDRLARQMESGTGAWLGPVGGYGTSGNYRRDYWANRGGMQLSNPEYYKVFYKGCTDLMSKYDFRYFKFDGISAQWTSVGPDAGTQGEENAEGIIYAEMDMRKVQPDLFFNTSVGTWASPFWFHITDAVWRQENDFGKIGNNKSDREQWITYRDRLVYQNFVQRSPMCPINNLMTHGFILSEFGNVSGDRDYDAVVREMRCAFACGSAMVELYADFKLMNSIKDKNGKAGALWGELSKCIEWQKKNAEVLPDIHWVGGNPWNGSTHEVYGWAAWNGKNAVLSLRNGANEAQTFETTLRKALDIPAYVTAPITLKKGFDDQAELEGLPIGTPIDLDQKLTLKLPGSSVYVFDNTEDIVIENYVVTDLKQVNNRTAYTLKSVNRGFLRYDQADPDYLRSSFVEGNRVDATPTGLPEEQFAFIRIDGVPEGHYYMYAMGAKKFVTAEGTKMALTTEPLDMVTLEPVAETDNQQFVVKFPGDKSINLTSSEDYYGTKLAQSTNDEGNMMTVTAVNHKAGLSTARAMVEDLYKYEKLVRDNWKAEVSSSSTHHEVAQMLDNNVATYWQSAADGNMPYVLTFDMGSKQKFCSFGYYARIDSEVGVCKSYAFDISNDQKEWKTVKSGELKFDGRKFVWGELGRTVEARYVRLTISSNQVGDQVAAISEFYLGYDGSAVTPEMNSLPLFSTEEAPQWYPVYFKKGGAYLQDMGAEQKLKTANQAEIDAQQWQFMGNEYGFIMKSKSGHYVTFKDERFFTTADKTQATELEFMQSGGYYLELKVKGSSKCMNQFGGAGAGKELGEWNVGDGGNVLQVKPVEIPGAKLPTFSDAKNVAWYNIQFRNGNHVIENKGEGQSVRLAVKGDAKTQLWKLVGDQKKFQIVSPEGLYMVVSDEAETEVGNQAGPNPHPVRTSAAPYEVGFKLVASENQNYGSAWEIQSNDSQFKGKSFNQHAGTNEGRTIGFWNAGDNNNPIEFVAVDVETAIEEVFVGDETVKGVYSLTGTRVGVDLKQLPKGVYIVNGKKKVVK